MFMEEIWMPDLKFEGVLTPESFAEYIIGLEKNNLRTIEKEDKNLMVAKIIRSFEDAKKKEDSNNDN